MAAEEGAAEHADELGRLVEAEDAPHQCWRGELADEVIGRGHEAGDGDAVEEAQDAELPRGRDESLWEGDEAREQQAGEQNAFGANAVGKFSEARGKQHARKTGR